MAFTASIPFPGIAALAPTLGAALVLWSPSDEGASPADPLGIKPVQWVGEASYSIYLWHWPLIVLVPSAGNERKGPIGIALILIATLLPSWVSKNLIEDRFRSMPVLRLPAKTFAMGDASMILITVLAVIPMVRLNAVASHAADAVASARDSDDPCVGARALDRPLADCQQVAVNDLVLGSVVAGADRSDAYVDDCKARGEFAETKTCTYGDGQRDVAIVGSSQAAHWLPALQKYAEDHDLKITTYFAASCAPSNAALDFPAEKSKGCQEMEPTGLQGHQRRPVRRSHSGCPEPKGCQRGLRTRAQ